MKILMTVMRSITFRPDDFVHTPAYMRDVKEWMIQHTVANNYRPVCTALSPDLDLVDKRDVEAQSTAAIRVLIAGHMEILHQVMSMHTRATRDYTRDFDYTFELYVAESGQPMKYIGQGHRPRE